MTEIPKLVYNELRAGCRQCIGTTDSPAKPVTRSMSINDLPYKDWRLKLKKEYDNRGPEYQEVNRGEHRMKGYSGHTHCEQVNPLITHDQTIDIL